MGGDSLAARAFEILSRQERAVDALSMNAIASIRVACHREDYGRMDWNAVNETVAVARSQRLAHEANNLLALRVGLGFRS